MNTQLQIFLAARPIHIASSRYIKCSTLSVAFINRSFAFVGYNSMLAKSFKSTHENSNLNELFSIDSMPKNFPSNGIDESSKSEIE